MFYRIFLVAASLLALPGQAQGLYKVIGADGRITYTDRPPPPAADAVVKPFGRPPATRPEGAAPAVAAEKISVVDAAVRVHVAHGKVASVGRFCSALLTSPTGVSKAKDALTAANNALKDWEDLHAELKRKKDAVLRDLFTQAALLQLDQVTQRENTTLLVRLTQMPAPAQLALCRQLKATLFSDEFDLHGYPPVVEALMNYRPRKLGRPGPVVQG